MCEQATRDLVTKVVTDKTNAQETFTAYDVSKAVQALQQIQGLPFSRHVEIGSVIHRAVDTHLMHNGGKYLRTSLPLAGQYAWFYHPAGVDPSVYRAALVSANPALDPPPVVQPTVTPNPTIDPVLDVAMAALDLASVQPNAAGVMQPTQSAS